MCALVFKFALASVSYCFNVFALLTVLVGECFCVVNVLVKCLFVFCTDKSPLHSGPLFIQGALICGIIVC